MAVDPGPEDTLPTGRCAGLPEGHYPKPVVLTAETEFSAVPKPDAIG